MAAQPQSAAFYYRASEYDPATRMMGRQVASEALLKAAALYDPSPSLFVYSRRADELKSFQLAQQRMGASRKRTYEWLRAGDIAGLARAGCLYRPDPVPQDDAWQRLSGDTRAYSICGITHTVSTTTVQRGIGQYLVAPYEEWDAVICTTHGVRRAIGHALVEYGAYLADRVGAAQRPRPALQLPVIPLGVHTADFDTATKPMQAARARWRKRLGIGDKDIVALFVGRLVYHAKANPLPMYRALEAAAAGTTAKVHLVQVGHFGDDHAEAVFNSTAKAIFRKVTCHFVDGRKVKTGADIWSIGDFFTSLADSVQESFGLAPVEAMAAGLPVVVSDWDGYRETVRHGVDGMLVRTLMTPPGLGETLARRHDSGVDDYDAFILAMATNVAVDVGLATEAYSALIADTGLRERMAAAGRKRARETFDWKRIYGLYRELWGELAERRRTGTQRSVRKPGFSASPVHPDPFRMFSHYPTTSFGPKSQLKLAAGCDETTWKALLSNALLRGNAATLITVDEAVAVRKIIEAAGGAIEAGAFLQATPLQRRDAHGRAVALLLKAGLIEVEGRIEVPRRAGPL